MRVKWAPSVILGGPFSKRGGGGSRKGSPKRYWYRLFCEKTNVYWCFAAILEHSGQLKKPGLKWLQHLGGLSGEIMTQTKERKPTERVYEATKVQSKYVEQPSNQCCCQWCFQNSLFQRTILILGSISWCSVWRENAKFMWHFFPNCGNPVRPCSRINPDNI